MYIDFSFKLPLPWENQHAEYKVNTDAGIRFMKENFNIECEKHKVYVDELSIVKTYKDAVSSSKQFIIIIS